MEGLWHPSDSLVICFRGLDHAKDSIASLTFWSYWPTKASHHFIPSQFVSNNNKKDCVTAAPLGLSLMFSAFHKSAFHNCGLGWLLIRTTVSNKQTNKAKLLVTRVSRKMKRSWQMYGTKKSQFSVYTLLFPSNSRSALAQGWLSPSRSQSWAAYPCENWRSFCQVLLAEWCTHGGWQCSFRDSTGELDHKNCSFEWRTRRLWSLATFSWPRHSSLDKTKRSVT